MVTISASNVGSNKEGINGGRIGRFGEYAGSVPIVVARESVVVEFTNFGGKAKSLASVCATTAKLVVRRIANVGRNKEIGKAPGDADEERPNSSAVAGGGDQYRRFFLPPAFLTLLRNLLQLAINLCKGFSWRLRNELNRRCSARSICRFSCNCSTCSMGMHR